MTHRLRPQCYRAPVNSTAMANGNVALQARDATSVTTRNAISSWQRCNSRCYSLHGCNSRHCNSHGCKLVTTLLLCWWATLLGSVALQQWQAEPTGCAALQRWRATLSKKKFFFFNLAALTASSTREREREKQSEKEKERENFETCLVSLFPASLLLVLLRS